MSGASELALAERLADRTLALVAIGSESRHEAAILDHLAGNVPRGFRLVDGEDAIRFFLPSARREGAPLVVLAGHADTVPAAGAEPPRREGSTVVGRGAADMKGSLAVMLEVAEAIGARGPDVGLLFFGREELPIGESALLPWFERCSQARAIDLAIVMEPTDNRLELGCLGNLNATVSVRGRAAHTARPWLGENAIHGAVAALTPVAVRGDREVTVDGLVFREVVGVTTIEGGTARNVIPDHVRAAVNLRYAPGRSPAEAEAELRGLVGDGAEITIVGNAPPGPVAVANPLVGRLREAGSLDIGPKQAWTPVAEFGLWGVDAVNFGPGDPGYAHRDDERIETAAMVRSVEVLRAFLRSGEDG
jgi:succinyl-diaminopimelate desuccinylase